MKICRECQLEKSLDDFYVAYRNKSGKEIYASDCKSCYNVKAVKRNRENPNRKYIQIKHAYGLDRETYIDMLKNGCAICGTYDKLCVDHDHETGEVRGVLCDSHNRGLACFQDDLKHLKKAIKYLAPRSNI